KLVPKADKPFILPRKISPYVIFTWITHGEMAVLRRNIRYNNYRKPLSMKGVFASFRQTSS
ncbi:MAG: hypothetical protein J6N99_08990, partial [Schwartzia sp.]|nr:hypothetical protein [Schwartzia sp. (in: firmicutes)]